MRASSRALRSELPTPQLLHRPREESGPHSSVFRSHLRHVARLGRPMLHEVYQHQGVGVVWRNPTTTGVVVYRVVHAKAHRRNNRCGILAAWVAERRAEDQCGDRPRFDGSRRQGGSEEG